MNLIDDNTIDFDAYFQEQQEDGAKVRPASTWTDEVIDRFYGQQSKDHWRRTGWNKVDGKFNLRPGEVTIWAGINGHGKTSMLSHVMLNQINDGSKACLMSLEMKPAESMAKMCRQAAGLDVPSITYIKAFHQWTDQRLWIYDHLGRLQASRALAVATYVRKELGIDHLVIDSLMKCGLGTDDYTAQKDFVDGLCTIARDTGLHIHLVCHMRKGENERMAPDKFSVKGASEITDLVDNVMIVWKNLRKSAKEEDGNSAESADPDAFLRVAKQRHHPWEGTFSFWFDRDSQQFKEYEKMRPTFIDLTTPTFDHE